MAYKKVDWQDWPAKVTPINAENLNQMDDGIKDIDDQLEALKAVGNEGKLIYVHNGSLDTMTASNLARYVGSPAPVTQVSQMTDSSLIYLYEGSESGMVSDHWYYYNGTTWIDGGAYNAPTIETDKTLSISDKPADGKAVGININLQVDTIPGTVQTITYDAVGNIQTVTHTKNDAAFRTDTFSFTNNSITEVRTLSSGETLTIVTNTQTLQMTVTYSAS